MSSRVMMIGLDAGSLDFIEASLSSLPNLRRAIELGVRRRLRSTTTELLPAASWPTLYTGTPPGAHGFYYPMQWDPEAMRMRHVRDWLYCEPFWYELERRGRRVVALDVPMTWPSRLQHGVEITDWGAHDHLSEFSARPARSRGRGPAALREVPHRTRHSRSEIARPAGAHARCARRRRAPEEGSLRDGCSRSTSGISSSRCSGRRIAPGIYSGRPRRSEGRSHPAGALLDVYRAVDDVIGHLVEGVNQENTTLVILSAHGMGPNASQDHFTRMIMDRVNERFHDTDGSRSRPSRRSRQRSLMRFLRERLPAPVQDAVGQAMPIYVNNFVVDRAITGGHDWPHTPALAVLASGTGYVRFNLRGRETHGVLEPGSETHGRYVRWMRECFQSFRIVETGEPLVKDIVFTSEAFPGERQGHLPDALISWNGFPLPASTRICWGRSRRR